MLRNLSYDTRKAVSFAAATLLLGGLLPAPMLDGKDEAPPSFTISPLEEVILGERAVAKFMKDRVESKDVEQVNRLNLVGGKLAKVCDRPSLPYRFVLIEGDDLQARSVPGGTVLVTEALMRLYGRDDELGFAIGHELAHTALRHHIQQTKFIDAIEAGMPGEIALLKTLSASFRTHDELEADRFGALYSVRAGYLFTASLSSLRRLDDAIGHASDNAHFTRRIETLESFREELEGSRKAFDDGLEALDEQNAAKAIKALTLFVAEFPTSVAGRVNLGLAYIARMRDRIGTPGNLAEVLEPLRDPGFTIKGSILDRADADMARGNFERAIEIQPDSGAALAGLGVVHTRLHEYDDARKRLRVAHETVPTRWDIVLCLGNVEYLDGRHQEAVRYYEQALAMKPRAVEIKKNLALALGKLGKRLEAVQLWEELQSDPHIGPEAKLYLQDLMKTSPGS